MPDELIVTEPVVTEPVVVDPPNDPPQDPPQDPPADEKFNKAQMQQISSVMGNLIKKAIDENVAPMIQQQRAPMDTGDTTNPAVQKFNEQLQEKIFAGDVMGAFDDYAKVKKQANQNLSNQQQTELNKAISGFEEKPFYKEVHKDFEKMAKNLMSEKGYPVEAAAELAYQTVTNKHMVNAQSGENGSLNMTTGGKRTFTPNTGKLPEQFEAAYQRDKAKGLFKDRKDYISSLSPQVRKQYEI
jgi:hypothetical protein